MLTSSKLCKKCEAPIPNRMKIEGRFRNLQSRKFRLECSPFQKHNTRPDGPRTPEVIDRRVKWRRYAAKALQKARRIKHELVELAGGCCTRCAYARYEGALEFHHRDPATKVFELTATNLRYRKRSEILAEFSKCTLVCSNCHREIESELRDKLTIAGQPDT